MVLVWITALLYSFSTSGMLILNKSALAYVPLPTFLILVQTLSCAIFVWCLSLYGSVSLSRPERGVAVAYWRLCASFSISLYANLKILTQTSVSLVIAARCCLPFLVFAVDYLFFDCTLPHITSWLSLSGVLFFVTMYFRSDFAVSVEIPYVWLCIWLASLVHQVRLFLVSLHTTYNLKRRIQFLR